MGLVSDARKAIALVRRAVASRSAVASVRHTLAATASHPLHHYRVAVYFADGEVNMYQMRQWYKPLAELAKTWPVVVLARVATGARALLAEDAPPVAFVPTVADLEAFLATQDIRVVLYVNQNTRNFQMFRYGRRWHVFINHGESDKMYMTTNQYKAYDYAFVAGEAARQRLARVLWDYDLDRRTIDIGRPQTDHLAGALPFVPDQRTVVLYAPTWEGDRPSAHYGSILSHGETLVTSLLATGTHRVIYRPHPRSGVVNREYGAANQRIIRAIAAANLADPTAQHVFDDAPELGWQLTASTKRRSQSRVRGGEPAHHPRDCRGQPRRPHGPARLRRRTRTGLAIDRIRRCHRRHFGDGVRPSGNRQAAARDAPGR